MMPSEYHKKRRKDRRKKFLALLGGHCEVCGSQKRLHFDHRKPKEKKFPISRFINRKEDFLLDEIKKCQLLCADCHAIKTRNNWEYTLPEAKHGTIWRYKKYKCRCDSCKAAMSDYYHENK